MIDFSTPLQGMQSAETSLNRTAANIAQSGLTTPQTTSKTTQTHQGEDSVQLSSEMVALMTWAQHIVTLRPDAAAYVLDVSPVFKIHLVLGMTLFLIFPFTRLVHIWSAPVWYLGRRGYQIVRTKRTAAVYPQPATPRVTVTPARRPQIPARPVPASP